MALFFCQSQSSVSLFNVGIFDTHGYSVVHIGTCTQQCVNHVFMTAVRGSH